MACSCLKDGFLLAPIQVLIVDDNKAYREAFRRNLVLRGYEASEAEDSAEALESARTNQPDVVVTDLAMSHPTEGLDLIRQLRSLLPHLPVIMISAVGTFDEGAEATRLGACQVISKSRIEEEMGALYDAIEDASRQHELSRRCLSELSELAELAGKDKGAATSGLNTMLRRDEVPQTIKREIFDRLTDLRLDEVAAGGEGPETKQSILASATQEILQEVEQILAEQIHGFATLQSDSRQSLSTAEFLFQQSRTSEPGVDFSRSMGFAYCFAVENEVKARLRKRMQKFFGDPATPKLVAGLLEDNRKTLSMFYQQYLLRSQAVGDNEATIDNYYHTLRRMLEHRGKYKPDGLKALGIVLICFGRSYSFRKFNEAVAIDNPLGLKGFDDSNPVMRFASLLINLQHYRNPYIHPEISEMTKLSQIRETAFACLNIASKVR